MIVFITTQAGVSSIVPSLPVMPADLRQRIRVTTYGKILQQPTLPAATYVFADIERLRRWHRHRAAFLWRQLSQAGPEFRVLNHPVRSLDRYALLRRLRRDGINAFDVRRPTDLAGLRYPVFVRGEQDHRGARSGLIGNEVALVDEIDRLEADGMPLDRMLIVEFCDTADERGIYRKYDAYIANGRIVPVDMYHSGDWNVKLHTHGLFKRAALTDDQLTAEQLGHLHGFDRHEQLGEIAKLASIEYGRIDFSFLGDRMQIWEINTNPDFGLETTLAPGYRDTAYGSAVLPQISEATFDMLRSLDNQANSEREIRIDPMPGADRSVSPPADGSEPRGRWVA